MEKKVVQSFTRTGSYAISSRVSIPLAWSGVSGIQFTLADSALSRSTDDKLGIAGTVVYVV